MDELEILGHHGEHWIEDESKSSTGLNVLIGALFALRDSKLARQIGAEAQPAGLTLGLWGML